MMLSGILLRSTAAPTPLADDSLTQRSPSTSTSTRLAPRFRRSTVAAPAPMPPPSGGNPKLPLLLNLVVSGEPDDVRLLSSSPSDVRPLRAMSSVPSVWIGARSSSGF